MGIRSWASILLDDCAVVFVGFRKSPCMLLFPTRQEGVVRFYVGIRVCDASTPRPHPVSRQSSSPVDPAELDPAQYPARAARQWIPPSIPPERLASGSRRVSRQSGSPVDPAEYPARAARQWIPPSIPQERLASGSRRVSAQSSPPVDPAECPSPVDSRVSRQSSSPVVPQSIPPEQHASGSRRDASGSRRVSRKSGSPVDPAEYPARWIPPEQPGSGYSAPSIPLSWPVDPAKYPALASGSRRVSHQSSPPVDRVVRQWIPPSIPRRVAREWIPCRWILPSIWPVSSRSGSPVLASGSRQYPARAVRQSGFA